MIDDEQEHEIDEEEIENQISILKTKIAENPFDYDCHLELIKNLKMLNDLEELEMSRKRLSAIFPLSADIWLDWINDLKLMASTSNEKLQVFNMYTLAVKDYQDTEIWKSLFEFVLEECADEDSDDWLTLPAVRTVSQQALDAVGRHFCAIHDIFNLIVEIELFFLEKTPQDVAHQDYVRSLFLEMLALPHQGLEDTFGSYSSFESNYGQGSYDVNLKSASKIVSKTKAQMDMRELCEADLKSSDFSLSSFHNYMSSVKKWKYKQQKPSTDNQYFEKEIKALFQRAIRIYYYDAGLWISYLSFLSSVQPSLIDRGDLAVLASHAAMSSFSCMANPDLWALYLIFLESEEKSWDDIENVVTQGLSFMMASGDVDILTRYLVHAASLGGRYLSDKSELLDYFDTLEEYQKSLEVPVTNSTLQVTIARIVAAKFKDLPSINTIFSKIKHDCKSYIAWATIAADLHDFNKARTIYSLAVKKPMKDNELLYQNWIDFEIIHGSSKDMEKCMASVLLAREKDLQHSDRRNVATSGMAPETVFQGDQSDTALSTKPVQPIDETEDLKPKKRGREPSSAASEEETNAKKLKKDENRKIGDLSTYKVISHADAGNMVFFSNLPPSVSHEQLHSIVSKYGRVFDLNIYPNPESGVLEALVEFQSAEIVRKFVLDGAIKIADVEIRPERCRPKEEEWNYSKEEVKDTVYVSNLTGTMNKMELRDLFGQYGKIKEIRFPKNHGQKNYSFAYIQFETEESAAMSLSLHSFEYKSGLKMGVAISNPKKKTVHEVDKKRLFISNLADSIAEDDLREYFAKCGAIIELRLLRDQKEKSKGVAYLSFATETEASLALKLNGTRLDNRVIIVAIADPNKRKEKASKRSTEKSHVEEKRPSNKDPRDLAQTVFVPRSARKNPKSLLSGFTSSSGAAIGEAARPISTSNLSQDDFRQLFRKS